MAIYDETFCRSLSFATSLCQAILPNISLTGFKRWLTLMAAPFIARVALGAVQISCHQIRNRSPFLSLIKTCKATFGLKIISFGGSVHLLSFALVQAPSICSFTKLATFESGGSAFIKHFPLNRTTCHSQKNTSPSLSQLLLFFIIKYAQL